MMQLTSAISKMTLVALLCLLSLVTSNFGLVGAACTNYTRVTVSDAPSSADAPTCLAGRSPCKTLEYALSSATNCIYVTINCSAPLVLQAPITVGNVSGLTLAAAVSEQKVLCANAAGIAFRGVSDVRIVGLYWSQCSIRHPHLLLVVQIIWYRVYRVCRRYHRGKHVRFKPWHWVVLIQCGRDGDHTGQRVCK